MVGNPVEVGYMEEYISLIKEIEKLESMIPVGLFFTTKPDWKAVWTQIRLTGSSFKGIKFPTREKHQEAWNKFQNLVDRVKLAQEEEQKKWHESNSESKTYKELIISQAERAKPSDDGISDVILAIATGGVSIALSLLMGPFDEKKRELQACSDELKKGWDMLSEHKYHMLKVDKNEAFYALNKAKEHLDQAWADYKRERQKAFDDYQTEREQKHQDWRQRIQENISKLESRRERLTEIISHKESHLDELHSKLSDAWSDDYSERVSGWISEEEEKLTSLINQLNDVENWLDEARSKLN